MYIDNDLMCKTENSTISKYSQKGNENNIHIKIYILKFVAEMCNITMNASNIYDV